MYYGVLRDCILRFPRGFVEGFQTLLLDVLTENKRFLSSIQTISLNMPREFSTQVHFEVNADTIFGTDNGTCFGRATENRLATSLIVELYAKNPVLSRVQNDMNRKVCAPYAPRFFGTL